MKPLAVITVHGTPEPAGSKRGFQVAGQVRVVDANPRAAEWKRRVAQAAGEQYDGGVVDGPLSVEFLFYTPRPKSHYGTGRNTGRVKLSAPDFPITRPDLTKLIRGCEDALTGVIWRDDAQLVDQRALKRYADSAYCTIAVYRLATNELRAAA